MTHRLNSVSTSRVENKSQIEKCEYFVGVLQEGRNKSITNRNDSIEIKNLNNGPIKCRKDTNNEGLGRACTKCKKWNPWSNYHKKGSRRESKCKQCANKTKKIQRTRKNKPKEPISSFEVKFEGEIDGLSLINVLRPIIMELDSG